MIRKHVPFPSLFRRKVRAYSIPLEKPNSIHLNDSRAPWIGNAGPAPRENVPQSRAQLIVFQIVHRRNGVYPKPELTLKVKAIIFALQQVWLRSFMGESWRFPRRIPPPTDLVLTAQPRLFLLSGFESRSDFIFRAPVFPRLATPRVGLRNWQRENESRLGLSHW